METHRVKVRYTFEGWFDIDADSEEHAREIARQNCGLVIGGDIHTNNSMHVKDWEFDAHPEKRILSSKQIKQSPGRA